MCTTLGPFCLLPVVRSCFGRAAGAGRLAVGRLCVSTAVLFATGAVYVGVVGAADAAGADTADVAGAVYVGAAGAVYVGAAGAIGTGLGSSTGA